MVRKIWSRLVQPVGTLFIFIILFLIYSCTSKSSISKQKKEAFINTYVELSLARVKYSQSPEEQQKAVDIIFARNGTSREFLSDFLEKISSQPEVQQEIFQAIVNRLEKYESLPPDSIEQFWRDIIIEP